MMVELKYIHYTSAQKSNKPPIIVLHGYLCFIDEGLTSLCAELAEVLAVDVFGVDLRNHGRSPDIDTQDLLSMTNDVKEIVDKQGIDKITFYGHSFGGKIAQLFSLLYPAHVATFVSEDMTISKDMRSGEGFLRDVLHLMQQIEQNGVTNVNEASTELETLVKDKIRRDVYLRSLTQRSDGKFYWNFNLPVCRDSLQPLLDYVDLKHNNQFGDNKVVPFVGPVLFLTGENSTMFQGESIADKTKELFPRAKIEVVNKAGHFIRETQYGSLFSLVVLFLKNMYL